jgi:chromosome segregation ATPase
VAWVDAEWPETMQNALDKLWSMYHEANVDMLEDRAENSKMVKKLCDEKNKLEKKHSQMLADLKKFWEDTERKVMQDNYRDIKNGTADKLQETLAEVQVLKKEVEVLNTQLSELKQVHKSQADVMRAKQETWQAERDALKEEKKKIEYNLFDLFKANGELKEKIKKIKSVFDE